MEMILESVMSRSIHTVLPSSQNRSPCEEGSNSSDPYNEDQCTGTYLGEMTNDVWFQYEACADGSMTVSTCDIVDFDTDIVVYEGAGHSFSMPSNQGYDADVAKASRDAALTLFRSM